MQASANTDNRIVRNIALIIAGLIIVEMGFGFLAYFLS